jgi:hypothetical protein
LFVAEHHHRREESASFLKKRSKKLLLNWASGCENRTVQDRKFFGSFFQKRTSCLAAVSFLRTAWIPALAGITLERRSCIA